MSTVRRSVHDPDERDRIETGSSDQHSVNVIGRHQLGGVVRLDAPSIKDGDLVGPASDPLPHSAAEDAVGFCRIPRRGGFTRANGPHGLVREQKLIPLFGQPPRAASSCRRMTSLTRPRCARPGSRRRIPSALAGGGRPRQPYERHRNQSLQKGGAVPNGLPAREWPPPLVPGELTPLQ